MIVGVSVVAITRARPDAENVYMVDWLRLPKLFRRSAPYRLCWLTSDLAVSRQPAPLDWLSLRDAGIAAAFDLRAEASSEEAALAAGIRYARLAIVEGEAPALDDLLALTKDIAEQVAAGQRVVVFCREGRGRSPLGACATLLQLGLPLGEAYRLLRLARPEAQLTDVQLLRLEEAAAALAAAR